MRRLYILFFLLFPTVVYAQKEVVHPKKGSITFNAEVKIVDEALYQKSLKNFRDTLVGMLKAKFTREQGQSLDTNLLNNATAAIATMPLDSIYLSNLTQAKHIYQDSIITIPNELETQTINIRRSTFRSDENDATETPYPYAHWKESTITEFKNEHKQIMGYDCYKVIVNFRDTPAESEDLEFSAYLSKIKQRYELWVTEGIQSMFHPVVSEKAILQKYFPLEIIERNNLLEGMETIYRLTEISLSN